MPRGARILRPAARRAAGRPVFTPGATPLSSAIGCANEGLSCQPCLTLTISGKVAKQSRFLYENGNMYLSEYGLAMRHKTPDFAIDIHARMLARRFKHHAQVEAQSHAERLKQQGDDEGHLVWMDVAKRVQSLKTESGSTEN
jgi:hypothetical protein